MTGTVVTGPAPGTVPGAGPAWPDIDEVDFRIIDLLQADGRVSIARMAKLLALSVGTVRQRYERLASRGVVRAVALIDPAALGRRVVAYLDLTVTGDLGGVEQRLLASGRIAWLASGADYRTIYCQVSTGTNAELARLVNDVVRPLEGVTEIRTSIQLRSWSPVFRFSGRDAPVESLAGQPALWRSGADLPRPLDDVDRALLRCLAEDARMTVTAMTHRIGLSVPATRQRLVKLVNEGFVQVRTRPNPLSDRTTVVRFLLDLDRDSTRVAEALADLPNVSYISESTGPAGLQLEVICADDAQVLDAYRRAVAIDGITAVHVVRYRQVLLYTGRW